MTTTDQNFTTPSQGQSDWDSDLNGNFTIISRGYHVQLTAAEDINTGAVVCINSDDGLARHFDPTSTTNLPFAFAYKAVSSGEADTFVARGIVRSLSILSGALVGMPAFSAPDGTGYVVSSYSAADRPVGMGIGSWSILFDPGRQLFPEVVVQSQQITAVTGSLHTFTMDGGRGGFIRRILMVGASADLVELQFYSEDSLTDQLFETISGGVSVVGSFVDQAGLPYYNTDTTTISGLVHGRLQVMSDAAVGSDTIDVSVTFERFR